MRCSSCGDEAVTFQEYSGKHLCSRHFCNDIGAKAKHAIRLHRWLRPGDHIGVAMSDDRRSRALMFFLHTLFSPRRDIRITAIIIDEGTPGSGRTGGSCRYAETLGIPVIQVSSRDFFGFPLEEVVGTTELELRGPLRTYRSILLDAVAKEHGITKIATPDSLDDEALAVLMSVMSGEPEEILAASPNLPRKTLPLIHPFIAVSDDDIDRYAILCGTDCVSSSLPASPPVNGMGFSASIRTMMDDYTRRHPATKYSLMHFGENIRGAGIDCGKILSTCARCGDPFYVTCERCRIAEERSGHVA